MLVIVFSSCVFSLATRSRNTDSIQGKNTAAEPILSEPLFPLDWARKILTSEERGDSNISIRLWAKPPVVSVIGASRSEHSAVESAIDELNDVLKQAKFGTITLSDQQRLNDITLRFVNDLEHSFPTARGSYDFNVTAGGVIDRAWIKILAALPEHETRHVVLEELTQCFGFSNDSSAIVDSVFYESAHDAGQMTELGEFDKRLIWFAYRYLAPGDSWSDVSSILHSGQLEAPNFDLDVPASR
jgi:hypothetical protein